MVTFAPTIIFLFSLSVFNPIECKNYYLLNNEESNSKYVYSLFGLGNLGKIVNNGISNIVVGSSNTPQKEQPLAKAPPLRPSSPTDVRAQTDMTLCYYLGDDVENSHLQFNPQWQFTQSNLKGLYDYINQLTLGTNYLLGLQNYKLKWKGPYARTDKANRYPDKLKEDTLRVSKIGCDVVVFLVFNDFSSGQDVAGHKYSGFAVGGPCEQDQAKGYTVIVDQGFYEKTWMGPQILAHHLLLMLTSDLYPANDSRRYCPNEKSLLHKFIKAGEQSIDQCVVNMLNQSNIGLRKCLLDS